jgi:hypothetical protein
VLPFLLNNCESWTGVSETTIGVLDNLQNQFYRTLLNVPLGTPTPALYWECGGMLMKNRIIKKKLIFLHHIATLEKTALAFQIYEAQERLMLPGLLEECQPFLIKFGITRFTGYSKWKKLINEKMTQVNKTDILEKMAPYKKLDHKTIENEKFEVKSYVKNMNTAQARLRFRITSFMTKTVRMNFSSDPKNARDLWQCWHCDKIDSQAHILHCTEHEYFREGKSLDNDLDLVEYFLQVINLRENLDK